MVLQDENKIILTPDNIPILTCAKCGKSFPSRGKKDEYAINGEVPVYCDECEKEMDQYFYGGPLDGRKADS